MRIRLPWTQRLERAEAEVQNAKFDYERTVSQRDDVVELARNFTEHSVRNGWSHTLNEIFGG